MKRIFPLFFAIAIVLTACAGFPELRTPQPTEIVIPALEPTNVAEDPLADIANNEEKVPSYFPQPGDSKLTRANAFADSINLLTAEIDPIQIELLISGHLPTPCHELRVKVEPPDEDGNIHVEMYSVADPEILCAQVLRAFTVTVPLGSYPTGSYLVWVNGETIGNFNS